MGVAELLQISPDSVLSKPVSTLTFSYILFRRTNDRQFRVFNTHKRGSAVRHQFVVNENSAAAQPLVGTKRHTHR